MVSQPYDVGYLKAGLIELEDYLLSNQLYWNLGAAPPPGESIYPQLTIGTLLLVFKRLQARAGEGYENEYFDELNELKIITHQWKSAWIQKATREFGARLILWRNYIDDYHNSPEDNYDRYSFEISRRVLMDLLQPFLETSSTQNLQILTELDEILRNNFIPGTFIWDKEIEQGFPSANYWYLYGRLRENDRNY